MQRYLCDVNVFHFVFVCNVFWVEFQHYGCCCCCCGSDGGGGGLLLLLEVEEGYRRKYGKDMEIMKERQVE
jgi:hypothetical protein